MGGLGLEMRPAGTMRLTAGLRQAIGLLAVSNVDLAAHLALRAQLNPWLALAPDPPGPAGPPDRTAPALPSDGGRPGGGLDEGRLGAAGPGLIEHAQAQVRLLLRASELRAIAAHFVAALAPSGWLDEPLAAIAAAAGCPLGVAEGVLARLQQAEPAGLFARSLAECLRLQAAEAGALDPVMAGVLDHLALVGAGRLDTLANRIGATPAAVAARLDTLRGYDPKPGARFDTPAAIHIAPDLIARRGPGGGWEVALSDTALPAVRVRALPARSPAERGLHDEARMLHRAAERRADTLLRVGAEIVQRQARFLDKGPAALAPLRLRDVADRLGLHESTVSRATSARRIETPQGVLALRAFFSGRLPAPDAAVARSASAVRAEVGRLIAGEPPGAPLTDTAIAEALNAAGIAVARRTVAKYRAELGLAAAARRGAAAGNA